MRRKRRYPTQFIKTKNTTIYQPVKTKYPKSGKKWVKFFFFIVLVFILAYVLKYIYDTQYFSPNSLIDEVSDTTITQSQGKNINQEKIEETPPPPPPIQRKIQIEILNGCGVNGIAKIFAEYLRQEGFDVVNTDNYIEKGKINWNLAKTKVIDQIRKPHQAEKVAEVIGVPLNRVISKDNPQAVYDVTVVLGKDFRKLEGFQKFKK